MMLSQAITVGGVRLPNRIVFLPCTTNYATPDGLVTDRQVAYYAARAAGGVGTVTVEGAYPSREGRGGPNQLAADRDEAVSGLARIAAAVRAASGVPMLQLLHCGAQTTPEYAGGAPVSPATLDRAGIARIALAYGAAARRAQAAGFAGVELHAAHGYLPGQFLSPLVNRRADAYGGDAGARARFVLEVIAAIRAATRPPFAVTCRLSAEEHVDGGLVLADAVRIARRLDGAADAINVSGGTLASIHRISPPAGAPQAVNAAAAAAIRSAVSVPVIVGSRITRPDAALAVLAAGQADMVGLGRALLADPAWAAKALDGRAADIRPCIGCMVCNARRDRPYIICAVNPATGRELTHDEGRPARRSLQVGVLGPGVAGLEFARVAARRGHRVTVYAAQGTMGGLTALRARVPGREELGDYVGWLQRACEASGVRAAPPAAAERDGADRWVVADAVREPSNGVDALDVLAGAPLPAGGRVAVLGGGLLGAETALYVAPRVKQVTLVEARRPLVWNAGTTVRRWLDAELAAAGVLLREAADGDHDLAVSVREPGPGSAGPPDALVAGDAYDPALLAGCVERAAAAALDW